MTQQQFIQEFRSYPITKKAVVIRQLLRIFEDDLESEAQNNDELSVKERKAAYLRLRGVAKMENPPMTKEEVREDYYNYLAEKYK